jgi:hypothetical protein
LHQFFTDLWVRTDNYPFGTRVKFIPKDRRSVINRFLYRSLGKEIVYRIIIDFNAIMTLLNMQRCKKLKKEKRPNSITVRTCGTIDGSTKAEFMFCTVEWMVERYII